MKFRTIETQVPWKFKWKAIDKDGAIVVFTMKPKYDDCGEWWHRTSSKYRVIGQGPKPADWTKTLERI